MLKLLEGGATRRKMVTGLLGGLAAAGAAGVAQAQPRIAGPSQPASPSTPSGGLIKLVTLDMMEPILQKHGFQGVQRQSSQGHAHLTATFKGLPVSLRLGGNEENTSVVYFGVEFGQQNEIDGKYINAWNMNHSVSALYRMPDNTLMFRMGIIVWSGVTADFLDQNTRFFVVMLERLLQYKPDATS